MKKLSVSLAVLSLVFVAFWAGCRKEEFPNSAKGAMVKTTISGQVVSEYGYPIIGATIRFEDAVATTDFNGVFRLKTQKTPSDRAVVTIEKDGFWKLTKTLMIGNNSHNTLKIRMLRKIYNGSFQAGWAEKVDLPGGISLNFPANAIGLNGEPYQGLVSIARKFLSPNSPTLHEEMQGALRGIRADGSEQGLATFGMLGVELTGYGGVQLQILEGQQVEISIPISDSVKTTPPQTIPLWHFDDTEGLWIEEGQAEKIGKNYVGKVSHFSWWNWDVPTETVNLKMRLISKTDGMPMANQPFSTFCESLGIGGHGQTDGDGFAESLVPKNAAFELVLQPDYSIGGNWCQSGTFEIIPINAINEDTDLGNIEAEPVQLNAAHNLIVKGRLATCSGENLATAYFSLVVSWGSFDTSHILILPDENGQFSYEISRCDEHAATFASLKAWDVENLQKVETSKIADSPNLIDFGTVVVCDPIEYFIKFTFDETEVNFTEPHVWAWLNSDNPDWSRISSEYGQFYLDFVANTHQSGTSPARRFRFQDVVSDSLQTNIYFNIADPGSDLTPIKGFFGGSIRDTFGILHIVQDGEYRLRRN